MAEQTVEQVPDFEQYPPDMDMDETDVAVRAYVKKFTNDQLEEFDPNWTDEQIMEWDENFRNDGGLMLVCCERDVDVDEYREVMKQLKEYRQQYGLM